MGFEYEAFRKGLTEQGSHEERACAGEGVCRVRAEHVSDETWQITIADEFDEEELVSITVAKLGRGIPVELLPRLVASIAEDVTGFLAITARAKR